MSPVCGLPTMIVPSSLHDTSDLWNNNNRRRNRPLNRIGSVNGAGSSSVSVLRQSPWREDSSSEFTVSPSKNRFVGKSCLSTSKSVYEIRTKYRAMSRRRSADMTVTSMDLQSHAIEPESPTLNAQNNISNSNSDTFSADADANSVASVRFCLENSVHYFCPYSTSEHYDLFYSQEEIRILQRRCHQLVKGPENCDERRLYCDVLARCFWETNMTDEDLLWDLIGTTKFRGLETRVCRTMKATRRRFVHEILDLQDTMKNQLFKPQQQQQQSLSRCFAGDKTSDVAHRRQVQQQASVKSSPPEFSCRDVPLSSTETATIRQQQQRHRRPVNDDEDATQRRRHCNMLELGLRAKCIQLSEQSKTFALRLARADETYARKCQRSSTYSTASLLLGDDDDSSKLISSSFSNACCSVPEDSDQLP